MSQRHTGKGPITKMMARVILHAYQHNSDRLDLRNVSENGRRPFLMSLAHRGLIRADRDKDGRPAWRLTERGIEGAKLLERHGYYWVICFAGGGGDSGFVPADIADLPPINPLSGKREDRVRGHNDP